MNTSKRILLLALIFAPTIVQASAAGAAALLLVRGSFLGVAVNYFTKNDSQKKNNESSKSWLKNMAVRSTFSSTKLNSFRKQ